MVKKLSFFIFLLIALSFAFYFKSNLIKSYQNYLYYSPCDTPIEYKIGNIDPRFDIEKTQLLSDSKIAASIWNNAEGKNLLEYSPNANLTINLVYDARQQLNSKIGILDNNLNQQKNTLDPEIEDYKNKSSALKANIDSLNQQIAYWNSQGGAPKDVYNKLIQQQQALQNEANSLNEEAAKLGQSTANYNADAGKLNQTINNYEQTLKYKPEEGLYVQNGTSKSISIYIYNTKDEFIHTITHEMGHALGLSHVTDPNSIMFSQTNSSLTPSSQDLQELSNACQKRSFISIEIEKIKILLHQIQTSIQ